MRFLGRLIRSLWRVLDALRRVLHLVILLAIFAILVAGSRPSLTPVPSHAALVLHPEGRLVEQLSGSPFDRGIGMIASDHEPETLVRDLTESVRAASTDARIRVLVLDLSDLGSAGLTKLEAVAGAIRAFRATGKKVYAFARYATQEQYYLMAQADEAYLDPAGEVAVFGYAAYNLYFHDALERLGVDINVFKVGSHKSYPEPFTRTGMSPEDREQTLGVLNPLWAAYQAGVEHARGLPAGAVGAYVSDAPAAMRAAGGDAALVAEQRHLITGRKTWLEFERQISALVGEDEGTHSFNAIDAGDYLATRRTEHVLPHHGGPEVAVLVASGSIVDGDRPPGEIGGESFAALVRAARLDEDVKAIVLRIDSGGGSMVASEQIRQEVAAARAAGKPVVASFSSVAASGGYYIAMDSDEIFAEPTTITGSIGVFAIVPTFARTLGKVGVASDGVATSPLAGMMHLERGLDPAAKEVLQLGVEHAYHDFIAGVARGRHRTPEEIEAVAEGRVWIAVDAKRLGLVDALGDTADAVAAAAKRARLAPGSYRTTWREKQLTWRETLVRELRAEATGLALRAGLVSRPAPAGRILSAAEHALGELNSLNDPRGLYYYCGCELR